jgi:hypothetical protein
MKTTINISDDLLVRAKQYAAEQRCSVGQLIEESLQRELQRRLDKRGCQHRTIRWVTVDGGPPDDLDLTSREALYDWLGHNP